MNRPGRRITSARLPRSQVFQSVRQACSHRAVGDADLLVRQDQVLGVAEGLEGEVALLLLR